MVDLPQHAAQVALLRDLVLGRSPWAGEMRINLMTPYLVGYGLALPLALIMPAGAAIKAILTLAFAAFAGFGIAIRRTLGASAALDAYLFVSFFGFSYAWGLYTFLVAAPFGLAFIWLAIRYARQGGQRLALMLAALGVVLTLCHGLVCVLACAVGLALLAVTARDLKSATLRAWPFVAPLLLCAAFVIAHGRFGARAAWPTITMGTAEARILLNMAGSFGDAGGRWPLMAAVVMAALPFVGGQRVAWRRRESLAIGGVVLAAVALSPLNVGWIGAIYTRFALFLMPAYAWLFTPNDARQTRMTAMVAPRLGGAAYAIVALIFAWHAYQTAQFSHQNRDFETVLAHAAPGQRALGLVIDQGGSAAANPYVFMHFPLWYQADKHGLTDFNFAAFPSQVARLTGPPSPVDADGAFEWTPTRFDWVRYDGERYRYFFVRSLQPISGRLFSGADCPPALIAAAGSWSLFEHRSCAAAAKP